MAYQNRYDNNGMAAKKGRDGVDNYLTQLKLHGWSHTDASKYDDTVNHIDVHIKKGEEVRHVDIKGHKSWYKDGERAIGWFLLEHTNVSGKEGWLRGKNTHIAFEQKEGSHIGFIVAKRDELLELWNRKVDMSRIVTASAQAKYAVYTRDQWGRLDIISWVKLDDVLALPGTEYWEQR